MTTNIEQMHVNIEKMRKDIRMDERRILIQVIVGAAACIAAGVGIATYVQHQNTGAPVPSTINAGKP